MPITVFTEPANPEFETLVQCACFLPQIILCSPLLFLIEQNKRGINALAHSTDF